LLSSVEVPIAGTLLAARVTGGWPLPAAEPTVPLPEFDAVGMGLLFIRPSILFLAWTGGGIVGNAANVRAVAATQLT
jgi:hypothetical protein